MLQILEKRLKNNESNQCQTLWRAARAAYNISEQPNISKEKKKEYIYISYNYMKMAMDNNGKESSKCNTWYGIMLNAIGAYEGIKIMVVSSYRSFERQKQIWNKYFSNYKKQGVSDEQAILKIIQYLTNS